MLLTGECRGVISHVRNNLLYLNSKFAELSASLNQYLLNSTSLKNFADVRLNVL